MELNEIKKVLEDNLKKSLSNGRKRNIVFWYDDAGEFTAEVDELELSNAKILKLNGRNSFQVKYILEHEDQLSHYLVYAPFSKPSARENYLLDIQKYSIEFSADKAALLMRELNVTDDSLRSSFRKYLKFFNNKERRKSFKLYSLTTYTEETLDIAVLSVLCKLPYPGLEEVVAALLAEHAAGGTAIYESVEKFGDATALWHLIRKYYGYDLEQKDLGTLGLFLLVTGLSFSLRRELPKQWQPFVSPRKNDAVVFLSHFMGNANTTEAYRRLAGTVQDQIKLKEYLVQWELESYQECDLFALFDEAIIRSITENLLAGVGQFDKYNEIILERRTRHWFKVYENEYNAAYWACVLLGEWQTCRDTIKEYPPHDFFSKYAQEYCRIDNAYRKFIYYLDRAARREWFESLREKIENTYVNGYLNTLAVKWSGSIESLQEHWELASAPNQWNFFRQQVRPHLKKGERVFVIVSDALRYEAGRELAERLNTGRKGTVVLTAMQGVLPSCTSLGMACLLPYKQMKIGTGHSVNTDGVSSEGLENRNKILNQQVAGSIAVRYKGLMDLKREDFRRILSGKELIYIYHNSIDARGDHYPTESQVFDAVEETCVQLDSLVSRLINNVAATNIYIVADHGFIYQRKGLAEYDKTPKDRLHDAYDNRRFILTGQDEHLEGTLTFSMKYLLGDDTAFKCITPRGANRFPVKGGGANYVHGGALPQEIVVPLVHIKNERGRSAKNVQKVAVTLTSISRKITNAITYLEFFQTEKLVDKLRPCRLKLYLADQDGNRISNENIIIADIKSDDPAERKFREKFVLKNMKYDKSQKYYLIMEDEEEQVEKEYGRIPFMVDLAFSSDDFSF
jgi:uncharacterized protein (TIGR02687 family)